MAAIYLRGGMPRVVAGSAGTSDWDEYPVPGGNANAVVLENLGANPLLVAFSPEMRDAGESWTVAATSISRVYPAEFGSLFVKSTGGSTTFQALCFVRRG